MTEALKASVKALKGHMEAQRFAEAAALAAPLLADRPALAAAAKEGGSKARPLLYTLHALAGLANAQLKQWQQAEECYNAAVKIQDDQFPAWKGLYDVYTNTNAAKEKRIGVLEKLATVAPPGLKKLAYSSQLLRLQLEQGGASLTAADASKLSASIAALQSDPTLVVPAESKEPARDAAEVARLTLELLASALLAYEAAERAEKVVELKERLARQLKKYREERERADKLRAQQAASKAGAIAAAVKVAKAAAAPLSQAEEEADIVRRVNLKLERDFLERSEAETSSLLSRILSSLAPPHAEGVLDPSQRLAHERALARLLLHAHAHGVLGAGAASPEAAAAALAEIEKKSSQIISLTAAAPSPFASRVLLGLRWGIGGCGKEESLERQSFFLRCIDVLAAAGSGEEGWAWMAWHALAASIVSTNVVPDLQVLAAPVPPPLKDALAALGGPSPASTASLSGVEVVEAILRAVPHPDESFLASSLAPTHPASAAVSLFTPPSPLVPSFLSPVALAYSLQKQGEAKHREALSTVATALAAVKSYRAAWPFDARAAGAATHAELTLAAAYSTKVLDERVLDNAVKIYSRILKHCTDDAAAGATDTDAQVRALQGLAHCALLAKPRPDYARADGFVQQLAALTPHDEYVWSMRGFLALQEARATKSSSGAADPSAHLPRLHEAAQFLVEAARLNPRSAAHQLRLGQAFFEQDTPGQDSARTDPAQARLAFERAAELAAAGASAAPKGSAVESAQNALLSESLAMQGVWARDVAADFSAAKKLFVAALKIDPSSEVAGPALCEAVLAAPVVSAPAAAATAEPARAEAEAARQMQSRVGAVRAIALAAVSRSPRCVWAWVRLARCQVSQRDSAGAIVSYQNALRVEDNTATAGQCWQELAECYNAEGQFVAAYKSVARCAELSAAALAAAGGADPAAKRAHELNLFLLAKCQLNMGATNEAIASLESCIGTGLSSGEAIAAPFVPALKLLAEALYVQANVQLQSGAFDSSLASLDRAVAVGLRCVAAAADDARTPGPRQYASVWKLLGDCYTLYSSLPVDDQAAPSSGADASDPSLPLCEARKVEQLRRATRAYAKATHIDPTVSERWYDAALCQWYAALALHAPVAAATAAADASAAAVTAAPSATGALSPGLHPTESLYRQRGLALAKRSLLLCPRNSAAWQVLGVLATTPSARQHAFLAAVQAEPKDAQMAWTNLGFFYLQQSHEVSSSTSSASPDERGALLGLSRHALEVAQTIDPSNPPLWTAQGLFNTAVGTLEAYVQARACYQRGMELSPSPVARFGWAHTSYATGDLPAARFAATKFVQQCPRHAAAWNLHGLVLEHAAADAAAPAGTGSKVSSASSVSSRALEAAESFARAERLLSVDTQFAQEQREGELLRMVRVNRARALASGGAFDESVALYQALIQQAAAAAAAGADQASVLASALTLHVDLALVYARQGALAQAIAMQSTAVAISAQQIASTVEPAADAPEEQVAQVRAEKGALVLRRRELLLQQAQLLAQSSQYNECKTTLQQSVSEHPDFPHPAHYFDVMCALYAVALQQSDAATASYAVAMMAQCISGLLSGGEADAERVMAALLPCFYRVQAQAALLANDHALARRMHAKLIRLDPTNMQSWNEFYASILGQLDRSTERGGATPVGAILATASLPPLGEVHACRRGEEAFLQRVEILAQAFLAVGRVGPLPTTDGTAAAAAEDAAAAAAAAEAKAAEALFAPESDEAEEAEYADEGADEDVRAKPALRGVLPPLTNGGGGIGLGAGDDQSRREQNLHAGRLSAHLLHMDPTRSSGWGLHARALYAQAVQSAAADAAAAAPLFTKAIRMLQVHTTLLTAEITAPALASANVHEHGAVRTALMADLCHCQLLLVDSLLRRSQGGAKADAAADVDQAAQLLRSVEEQQAAMGATFPLHASLLLLMAARVALTQGDQSGSVALYRRAIEPKPLWVQLWEELSEVYVAARASQAAEACLQAPLALVQQAEAEGTLSAAAGAALRLRLLLRLSLHCYASKQLDRASEWATQACRETGEAGRSSPAAWLLLGMAQAALQHPDQANRAFQTALNAALGPRDSGYAGALEAAAASYPLGMLRFNMALLFVRTATTSSAPAGPLTEAQILLREELQEGTSGVASAPIFYNLALTAQKLNDFANAQSYISRALQLRPKTQLYQRLADELARKAASPSSASHNEVPESWDE